jgi:hypothetical protein
MTGAIHGRTRCETSPLTRGTPLRDRALASSDARGGLVADGPHRARHDLHHAGDAVAAHPAALGRRAVTRGDRQRDARLDRGTLAAESVCRSLIDRTPPWQGERRAFLIDGTTITLPPTSELARVFPPATNQHGETVWPVLLLLVAHELQTGCALPPELGAMYGPDNVSEARLAAALMRRLPACSLLLGDAGFGIFQVAWNVAQAGHTFLSVKDRSALPELPAQAALEVRLHATPLPSGERLLLVTSERAWSSAEAAEHYARRYDIEHDLRDFKVTLAVEKLRARSAAMVRKELLCSVVAYNLVQEFRRQAAAPLEFHESLDDIHLLLAAATTGGRGHLAGPLQSRAEGGGSR